MAYGSSNIINHFPENQLTKVHFEVHFLVHF